MLDDKRVEKEKRMAMRLMKQIKTELTRESKMDKVPQVIQITGKVIWDSLKPVATCWNSSFGFLELLVPELRRDVPDSPAVGSSLKNPSVTKLGGHLFVWRLKEPAGLLHHPGSGCCLHWAMPPNGDKPLNRAAACSFQSNSEILTWHGSESIRCFEGKLPYLCLYHVDATRP